MTLEQITSRCGLHLEDKMDGPCSCQDEPEAHVLVDSIPVDHEIEFINVMFCHKLKKWWVEA
jgi:hypothetical protein